LFEIDKLQLDDCAVASLRLCLCLCLCLRLCSRLLCKERVHFGVRRAVCSGGGLPLGNGAAGSGGGLLATLHRHLHAQRKAPHTYAHTAEMHQFVQLCE
jgi:hypothetical protein